ncbi:MAG: hypothetical protein COA79_14995 [Planctomycetota bacterium]|nr:MAG: hypothetical protein COA79_14995 [Planctomycetota bacterium]
MTKYILIISLFIIILLFTRIEKSHEPTYFDFIKNKKNIPLIKVLIKEKVNELKVTIDQKFRILNKELIAIRDVKTGISNGIIGFDKDSRKLYIKVNNQKDSLKVSYCKMVIPERTILQIGKEKYLGSVIIYVNEKNKLNVVNELDLETYLLGVLPGETFSTFGIEAIKSQVVASRTYALSESLKRQNKLWHLRNTTRSQVYKGMVKVHPKFKKAIEETRGLVLQGDEGVLKAYFSSHCGGATASLDSLPWEKNAGTVMLSRKCPWCRKMKPKSFYWETRFSIKKIESALKRQGYAFKTLKFLAINKKDEFSRVLKLEVFCSDKKFIVDATHFRTTIMQATEKLRSRMFVMKKEGAYYSFKGRGWGHGVGMCQYGSQGLSKENWGFRQILGYYYLGAKISKLYE